nr:hypothetical protein [uncultured Azospirillum sp.]
MPDLHGRHRWYGFVSIKQAVTTDELVAWEGHGANHGLHAARFSAIDIDVTDPKIRNFIQGPADWHLGPAPV